jgi:hypothetical protein
MQTEAQIMGDGTNFLSQRLFCWLFWKKLGGGFLWDAAYLPLWSTSFTVVVPVGVHAKICSAETRLDLGTKNKFVTRNHQSAADVNGRSGRCDTSSVG